MTLILPPLCFFNTLIYIHTYMCRGGRGVGEGGSKGCHGRFKWFSEGCQVVVGGCHRVVRGLLFVSVGQPLDSFIIFFFLLINSSLYSVFHELYIGKRTKYTVYR